MYYKETTWNPDGMHLDNVLWRKVYIDGVEHIKCNQRKFPVQLLRLALFTLGKCSQRKFPIKKFDSLLHINVAGVYFAKTHYSSLLMTTLWAAPFLIIISKEDEVLIRYIVKRPMCSSYLKTAELPSTFPNTSQLAGCCLALYARCLLRISDASSPILYQIAFIVKKCWHVVAFSGKPRPYRPVA